MKRIVERVFELSATDGGAEDAALQFGSAPSPEVRACLLAATRATNVTEAEAKLKEARHLDPSCLAVYFALYKFYFWRRRLSEAEEAAHAALVAAAQACGFDPDWRAVTPTTVDWQTVAGPERCYLFSLKALSFIRLRQGDVEGCRAMLTKLDEIDPRDQVGASVIRAFADGAMGAHRF